MVKSAIAQLRNQRGIGVDHWTALELEALLEAATDYRALFVRQIDVRLTVPLQRVSSTSCEAVAMQVPFVAETLPGRVSGIRRCSSLQLAICRRLEQEVQYCLREATAAICWNLQEFYVSTYVVRQLMNLGTVCGGSPLKVSVVDLQVHLGLGS